MKAQDVMTSNVVTARPEMRIKDIASLMASNHVSGLPVVTTEGDVLGMVSESDLLHRVELGITEAKTALFRLMSWSNEDAKAYSKSHGSHVRDVMSRPVISVDMDSELAHVASVMDSNGIKRVPVVAGKKLVGIVARSDLVRALSQSKIQRTNVKLGSGIIHQTLRDAMRDLPWLNTSYINSSVQEDVVRLWGYVESQEHLDALRVLVEGLPGVERVEVGLKVGMPQVNWDGSIVES